MELTRDLAARVVWADFVACAQLLFEAVGLPFHAVASKKLNATHEGETSRTITVRRWTDGERTVEWVTDAWEEPRTDPTQLTDDFRPIHERVVVSGLGAGTAVTAAGSGYEPVQGYVVTGPEESARAVDEALSRLLAT